MTTSTRRFLLTAGTVAALSACGAAEQDAGARESGLVPIPHVAVVSIGSSNGSQGAPRPQVASSSAVDPTRTVTSWTTMPGTADADERAVRVVPPVAVPLFAESPVVSVADVEVDGSGIDPVWIDMAECESNQRWAYNGSSGYDGGLQFSPGTWRDFGGTDFGTYAWQATPVEQVVVAQRLLDVQGWGAWPSCSRKLGLS